MASLLLSIHLKSQNTRTAFEEGLTYKEIIAKAKSEKKNIFIDMYATWCTNCKTMDSVFALKSVVEALNKNYISTKLQIDRSKNDNESIKRMYDFADEIRKKYKISSVPTYLFIDADGNLLMIESGVQSFSKLMEISKAALDPNENFTYLYNQYNKKELHGPALLKLARYLNLLNENTTSELVAKKYREDTWNNKDMKSILTAEFSETIKEFPFLYTTQDSLISYIYRNKKEADSLLNENGLTDRIVNYMIKRDFIDPEIKKNVSKGKSPDWDSLDRSLSKDWGTNAKMSIIAKKIEYYIDKKDWKQVTQSFIERTDQQGISIDINSIVWTYFFQRSNDPYALNKAISYMEEDLKKNPTIYTHIDTYANVLYKAGHAEKALQFEEKALKMAEAKNDQKNANSFKECMKKMKKGVPTWTDN